MKLTPSVNKTAKGSWNNFNSDIFDQFVKDFKPDFVDIADDLSWYNCEDTAVFTMPFEIDWGVVNAFNDLIADEFDFINLGENKALIRLWWD